MIDRLDSYESGEIDLAKLVEDLRGLFEAADIHDRQLRDEFELNWIRVDSELELRTEPWAPPGSASDASLREALASFRTWVSAVLARSGGRT